MPYDVFLRSDDFESMCKLFIAMFGFSGNPERNHPGIYECDTAFPQDQTHYFTNRLRWRKEAKVLLFIVSGLSSVSPNVIAEAAYSVSAEAPKTVILFTSSRVEEIATFWRKHYPEAKYFDDIRPAAAFLKEIIRPVLADEEARE